MRAISVLLRGTGLFGLLLALLLISGSSNVPSVHAQGSNPWETAVGQACFERWIALAMSRLNSYNGDQNFEGNKPFSINQYGILEWRYRHSAYAPDNFRDYNYNKYWYMWDEWGPTGWDCVDKLGNWSSGGVCPYLGKANVPMLRDYVRGCIADAGGVQPPSGGQPPSGQPSAGQTPSLPAAQCLKELETITVPATTPDPTSSRTVLENGQAYAVIASGVFSFWDPSGKTAGLDALYRYEGSPAPILWSPLGINDKPLLDWIQAAGGKAEYSGSHVYAAGIPGNGKPLSLRINDGGGYSDNSGSLTVKLCTAPPGSSTGTQSTSEPPSTGGVPGTTLPLPPFGSPEPSPNVSRMTLQAAQRRIGVGELVLVPIWLIKGDNVANVNFELTYDANVARPEGTIQKGNLLDDALFSVNPNTSGIIRAGFAQTAGVSGTGTVTNIPFRATGKVGDRTPLTVAVTTIDDPAGSALAIDRIPGEIVIVGPEGVVPGDCDGDGKLTMADAMCALQMSVQLIPVRLVMDMDNSGDVTSRDAVIIAQKVLSLIP